MNLLNLLKNKIINSFIALFKSIYLFFESLYKNLNFYKRIALEYKFQKDDIFIVTFPRSGTTWIQMIMYQLISDGNMEFIHINHKCPFFEICNIEEIDNLQLSPRIFKTHLTYKWIPKTKGKYIYIVRNGKDAISSYYHLFKDTVNFKGSFEEFFNKYNKQKIPYGLWSDHVSDWIENRYHLDLLVLTYEDMLLNLPAEIEKIITFCGFSISDSDKSRIIERSSFQYMKQHEHKFEHLNYEFWKMGWNLNNFIRKGKAKEGENYFGEKQLLMFEKEVQKHFKKQKPTRMMNSVNA